MTAAIKVQGYNPIRHDCQQSGCYLVNGHPKTEMFAGCFPRNISFSDMDHIVELGGRALVVEWKAPGGVLKDGQRIMWKKLTRGKVVTVFVVNGDPREMIVESYQLCWDGKWQDEKEVTTTELWDKFKKWSEWAETNPVFSVKVNAS